MCFLNVALRHYEEQKFLNTLKVYVCTYGVWTQEEWQHYLSGTEVSPGANNHASHQNKATLFANNIFVVVFGTVQFPNNYRLLVPTYISCFIVMYSYITASYWVRYDMDLIPKKSLNVPGRNLAVQPEVLDSLFGKTLGLLREWNLVFQVLSATLWDYYF